MLDLLTSLLSTGPSVDHITLVDHQRPRNNEARAPRVPGSLR